MRNRFLQTEWCSPFAEYPYLIEITLLESSSERVNSLNFYRMVMLLFYTVLCLQEDTAEYGGDVNDGEQGMQRVVDELLEKVVR